MVMLPGLWQQPIGHHLHSLALLPPSGPKESGQHGNLKGHKGQKTRLSCLREKTPSLPAPPLLPPHYIALSPSSPGIRALVFSSLLHLVLCFSITVFVWLYGFSDSSTSQRCPILSLDTGALALAVTCFHSHAACHCEVTSMTAYAVARALSESHGEAERDWGPQVPHVVQYHSATYIKQVQS